MHRIPGRKEGKAKAKARTRATRARARTEKDKERTGKVQGVEVPKEARDHPAAPIRKGRAAARGADGPSVQGAREAAVRR